MMHARTVRLRKLPSPSDQVAGELVEHLFRHTGAAVVGTAVAVNRHGDGLPVVAGQRQLDGLGAASRALELEAQKIREEEQARKSAEEETRRQEAERKEEEEHKEKIQS